MVPSQPLWHYAESPRIYMCHSQADNGFAHELAKALRGAGADVWVETHFSDAGAPGGPTVRVLEDSQCIIVVLSTAALASSWVWHECQHASMLQMKFQSLHSREQQWRSKQLLPSVTHSDSSEALPMMMAVVAQPFEWRDFDATRQFMVSIPRIEAAPFRPYEPHEAITHVLESVRHLPHIGAQLFEARSNQVVDELIARGKALDPEPTAEDTSGPPAVWCLAANVAEEQPFGPGGKEIRRGTKHFAPGAKVYCFRALWGDGYEDIKVVGHHRGSHRYATLIMPSKRLTNWRADLVYSPHVIAELAGHWDGTAASKQEAEELATEMRQRESARPPQNTL